MRPSEADGDGHHPEIAVTEERPNILLLMTDQMRGDFMRCAGHPCIQTWSLDQLADEGVLFERAYTECPVCVPARHVLATGKHPETLDMRNNRGRPLQPPTLQQQLSEHGYQTLMVGKTHYTPYGEGYGFEKMSISDDHLPDDGRLSDYQQWLASTPYAGMHNHHGLGPNVGHSRVSALPESFHETTWVIDESIRFLEHRDTNRPFFLMTSFRRPHAPYDPPAPYDTMYDPAEIPAPFYFDIDRNDLADTDRLMQLTRKYDRLTRKEILQSRAHYMGLISHIDCHIGRLIGFLQKRGLYDNTLVLFLSDHGDMAGDRRLMAKYNFYDGSARIPMILALPRSWKDRATGLRCRMPVGLRDMMPTLLDAAGIAIDGFAFDGRSLLDIAKGHASHRERLTDGVIWVRGTQENAVFMITDGKEKLLWYRRGNRLELYNLDEDPEERNNLAGHPSCRALTRAWVRKLEARLQQRHASYALTDDGRLAPTDPLDLDPGTLHAVDQMGRRQLATG